MKKDFTLFLVFAFLGSAASPLLFAAEMSDQTKTQAAAEVEKALPEAPEKGGVTKPAESSVVPTPSVDLMEGAITAIDLESETPSLKLKTAAGQESAIYLDFETSAVWKGGQELILEDLKAGQNVKVRYTESEGKKTAKTIEVV